MFTPQNDTTHSRLDPHTTVSGVQLSRLTMLPIAEWHRGLFMESHGEKQEEEEGEVEQEIEGNKEEDNNQTPVRMPMDEME